MKSVVPSNDWDASEASGGCPPPVADTISIPVTSELRTPHSELDVVRRFVQVMVGLFCLFLVVRTAVMEPFGVPTGSMAGALVGNHRERACPDCGYPVRVGSPVPGGRAVDFDGARCPNCGGRVDMTRAVEIPGDRLLVDKTAFQVRAPRRWEIAVFRCPSDLSKPYVKRVVGLPGESIRVVGGDVYADGTIARKTLTEVRETRVPFLDMNFVPAAGGWADRWRVEPIAGWASADWPGVNRFGMPAGPTILRGSELHLDATTTPIGLTYRHWDATARDTVPVRDWLMYNGPAPTTGRGRPADVVTPVVHDFVFECDLEVVSGSGVFACRLGDGADHATADLPIGGELSLATVSAVAESPPGDPAVPRTVSAQGVRLEVGRTYHLEFAFVDRRVSLAIDGEVVVPPLDLPAEPRRGGVRRPLQLGARGVSVAVRNLKLYHDIHYRSEGRHGIDVAHRLGGDEYFFLGDNTTDSHDSREWPVPGVPGRDFIGRPFLIHQPMRLAGVRINGRDRTFQSVDWSRLRWLR